VIVGYTSLLFTFTFAGPDLAGGRPGAQLWVIRWDWETVKAKMQV